MPSDGEMRAAFEAALAQDPYDEHTHRVFSDFLYEQGEDALAEFHATWTPRWQHADDYLREFAEDCKEGMPVEVLINAIRRYVEKGEHTTLGTDLGFWARDELDNAKASRQFWDHWKEWNRESIVRGGNPFTCCYQEEDADEEDWL